ncbi:MAG: endopeptidase La, partial [Bacteroidales bacterium]|nr:endopeptidase La [Bacteroidales bacterium]
MAKKYKNSFELEALEDFIGLEPITIPMFDEKSEDISSLPETISILPLRNAVLFPGTVIPITIGRKKSIKLINDINNSIKIFGAVSQKNANLDDPDIKDMNSVGTIAEIVKIINHSEDTISVIIRGKQKFQIENYVDTEPYFTAKVKYLLENTQIYNNDKKFTAVINSLKDISVKIISLNHNIPVEFASTIKNMTNNLFLVNFLCSNAEINYLQKQELLEIQDLNKRAIHLLEFLNDQLQLLEIQNDIQKKTRKDLDKQQRDYYLQQEMKAIQDELGNGTDSEVKKLKQKAKSKKWFENVKKHFNKELEKFSQMHSSSPEYSVQFNYLNTMLELPWNQYSKDNFNIKDAQKILDEDHFGLEKVKERILEYLAVIKLKGDLKSPILCLYGPPGVGKTSLGKSIARSLNREYVRMSLGGLHDESEIRGHRKTYIGAMPGRILQNIKKAGTSNPVFVLDEIDKVGNDFHGDPTSALLEVLDPEQNTEFHDNFLEIEYDLSKVMFIATANSLNNVNQALLDRMELIDVSGYILEEKIEIAKQHLVGKQLKDNGLQKYKIKFTDKSLEKIIDNYTRESGVRGLDKKIATIVRHLARKIVDGEECPTTITEGDIEEYLGIAKYSRDTYADCNMPGIVTGLAWTATGGEILYIETSLSKGKGNLSMTGNLGDVMKESATIALEYIKANYQLLNLDFE